MPVRPAALLIVLILLASCSALSREKRIEAKLETAGLKPKLARCLAPRLARDLDDDRLRTLARAADGGGHGKRALRHAIEAIGDPRISDAVSGALIGCAIPG